MGKDPSWQRIKAIFNAALELAPDDRQRYLDEACGDDSALRPEVESLLAASDTVLPWLGGPAIRGAASWMGEGAAGPFESPGRLGDYRVLRELGRGGMGEVYLAERDDGAFQARVAIKLLRPERSSPDMLRRFHQERQILASLEHASIARLLDGGVAEDGRPYLVMEWIDGAPIDHYCEEHSLDLRQRLDLFRKVCQAVQHAHRHLVVHSDLKPDNILVTAEGEPKLLDFGVAKLLGHDSVPRVATTASDEFRLMTPEYASPEQIRGEVLTTATDIYSLGVLLYRLLTGVHPYHLARRARQEVERIICEEEPERPSTVCEQRHPDRGDEAETGSAASPPTPPQGRPWPEKPGRLLRGDLDNITLMALRKEPERRYPSAEQLDEDLGRHLQGLPVRACKDTPTYRARKFLRRHRWEALAAAFVVLALVSGILATTWQARRARVEAENSSASLAFLEHLFRQIDPTFGQDPELGLRAFLDEAVHEIDRLEPQPVVRATLLRVVGEGYRNLGLRKEARDSLEQALGLQRGSDADPAEVARTLDRMGLLALDEGNLEIAEKLLDEALAAQIDGLGERHVETARMLNSRGRLWLLRGLWAVAEADFNRALDLRLDLLGSEHRETCLTRNNLGVVLEKRALAEGSPSLIDEAIELHRRNLQIQERTQSPRGLLVANSLNSLGTALQTAGQLRQGSVAEEFFREAADSYERALALYRETLREGHPRLAGPLHNLADLRRSLDPSRALALIGEAVRITGNQDPLDPITLAKHLMLRGAIFHAATDSDRSASDFRRALDLRRERLGPGHAETADSVYSLTIALEAAGRLEVAEVSLRRLLEAWPVEPLGSDAPPRHWDRPYTQARLGQALLAAGRNAEARPWLELGRDGLLEVGRQTLVQDLGLDRALDRLESPP